jgi:hypothetical protein
VGSYPRQRLSDEDLCRLYVDEQKTQAWLGLKARLSSARVRDILVANGVRLRTSPEVRRLAVRTRMGIGRRCRSEGWPSRPVYKGDDA